MMEAASTSETSTNFYQITRRINPEDSHLHTRRRENLKSHMLPVFSIYLTLHCACSVWTREFCRNLRGSCGQHSTFLESANASSPLPTVLMSLSLCKLRALFRALLILASQKTASDEWQILSALQYTEA
jgi:hypothetical protein